MDAGVVRSRVAPVRWGALFACAVLALVGSGCSSSTDDAKSTDTTGSTARASKVVCNGTGELNQDDDGAVAALLQRAELPSGRWTIVETPPCPWALSADELLATPECRT